MKGYFELTRKVVAGVHNNESGNKRMAERRQIRLFLEFDLVRTNDMAINLTIDGKPVSVPPGTVVADAAKKAGLTSRFLLPSAS